MKLSQSIEDYLETIYIVEMSNKKVKSVDIANLLHVSKPAVTKAMNELIKLKFVNKTPYSEPKLTDKGKEIAANVYHRHLVIHSFLENKLGLSHEIAERDCCMIEHVISTETLLAMENFIKEKEF